ncbi:MAG: hypothetical protein AAGA96_18085 [Verrucomicrobiota bacterium]
MSVSILPFAFATGAIFVCVSCQPVTSPPPPVTPIVTKAPELPKPKVKKTYQSKPDVPAVEPLDTTDVEPLEIPKFEVPDNIQPKISDGIDQSEFIELKWTEYL